LTPRQGEPVVVGLDDGYVRSRHREDERHFEVIADKRRLIDDRPARHVHEHALGAERVEQR